MKTKLAIIALGALALTACSKLTTAEKQWVPWHVHGAMKTVSTLKSYLWVIKPLPSLTMD